MPRKDPTNIRMTDHVVIRVRNLSRVIDFYCYALGCWLERGSGSNGLTQLRAGESFIDKVRGTYLFKTTMSIK
jgi:catechol 2,3-dioxygenase-like lactoylglutathione lyase family enzyme